MKLFSLLWLTLLSCCPATVEPPMKLYMMLVVICSVLKYYRVSTTDRTMALFDFKLIITSDIFTQFATLFIKINNIL